MLSVVIQLPDRLIELAPGDEVTFGRSRSAADIVLDDPAISRVAGRIRAVAAYWTVSNLSSRATYIVENPEGGGEFLKVVPRRLDMPVPFEIARLVLPTAAAPVSFTVFAPEHAYQPEAELSRKAATKPAFSLSESAKYFLVLVALCEPRLRDGASVVLPTVSQIVERLHPLESCRDLTRTAVNFHIDYLARIKLRVRDPETDGDARADWQRAALVATAVRFNLVREEHLAMLPSRRSPS